MIEKIIDILIKLMIVSGIIGLLIGADLMLELILIRTMT
jgi:hypothetical protein